MFSPTPLPPQYAYLAYEPAPKILPEALKWHGLAEVPGAANNPYILAQAEYVGPRATTTPTRRPGARWR